MIRYFVYILLALNIILGIIIYVALVNLRPDIFLFSLMKRR